MNALIFLVPEDIVDVRPRLVRPRFCFSHCVMLMSHVDSHFRWKFDGYCVVV